MATYTEESEDDAGEGIAADELFAFGTPPTRSATKLGLRTKTTGGKSEGKRSGTGKPNRVASSKRLDTVNAVARQARNMTAARRESKGRRQKARQQARFFKEIDTTLEALGIGTAPDTGVLPAGSSISGLPPSPLSSTVSLSLAFSSDAQLAALATPTALSSRAGTPPLGPPAAAGGAGGAGATSGGAEAPGDLARRVAGDMLLKSSDLPSGCSNPERHPSNAGMVAAGPGTSATMSMHRRGLAMEMRTAATATLSSLPPRSPATGTVPAAPTAASGGLSPPLTIFSQLQPAPVDRRRTMPQLASAAAAAAAVSEAGPGQPQPPHRRSASYEAKPTTTGLGGIAAGGSAAAAAPAGPVQYHPTPVRAGWAAVLMSSSPPPPPPSAEALRWPSTAAAAGATVITASAAAESVLPSTLSASRSVGAQVRDAFRRQLGSVLVGHGVPEGELQTQVEEAEERGEGVLEEMNALAEEAERIEVEVQLYLNAHPAGAQPLIPGATFFSDIDRGRAMSWQESEKLVHSLDKMYRKVKDVLRKAKPLRSHLAEDPELLPRLHALAVRLLGGLVEAAEALGKAACSGLQSLGGRDGGRWRQGGEDEVRASGRTVRQLLDSMDRIFRKISDELKTSAEARALLGRCQAISLDIAHTSIKVAEEASPVLLTPSSLAPHSFAHEKSSQAKRLVALWEEAARQTDRIARRLSRQRLSLYTELCEVFENAGLQALEMTRPSSAQDPSIAEGSNAGDDTATEDAASCDDGGDGISFSSGFDSDVGGSSGCDGGRSGGGGGGPSAWGVGAAGAWSGGRGAGSGPGQDQPHRGASAAEIEAQAWVPSLLQVLLNRASEAHRNLRNELAPLADRVAAGPGGDGKEEAAVTSGGGGTAMSVGLDLLGSGSGFLATAEASCELSDEQVEEMWCLLDEMQQTFAELCIANLQRTVWLCAGGSGPLPLWALESVRDSSEAALRFIHTHEHCSMALGDMLDMTEELEEQTQRWLRSTWANYTNLTRRVVNGLLSIRRQINVRRTVTAGEPGGRGAAVFGAPRGALPGRTYGRGVSAAGPAPGRGQQTHAELPVRGGGAATGLGAIGAALPLGRQQQQPPPLTLSYQNPNPLLYLPLPFPQNAQQQFQPRPAALAANGGVSGGSASATRSTVASNFDGVAAAESVASVSELVRWTLHAVDADGDPSVAAGAGAASAGSAAMTTSVMVGGGGGGSWKNALLARPLSPSPTPMTNAASSSAVAGGGSGDGGRTGRPSIDGEAPVQTAQPSEVSHITSPTESAGASTSGKTCGTIHTSISSSRLSGTPGPNSGAQRRVAAKSAAEMRADGGRHGTGGRGHGRVYGRGRSRSRGANGADGAAAAVPPQQPPPPPPPPPQEELPSALDPWPRLRPNVVIDTVIVSGPAEDDKDHDQSSAAAATDATAAVPMPPHPTSPVTAPTLASPTSPRQLLQPQPSVISWASIARGSTGGAGAMPPVTVSRPSTSGSNGGGGDGAATRAGGRKSPFEVGAGAQRAAAAAAGSSAAAGGAGSLDFVASPFKPLAQQLTSPSRSPHRSRGPSAPPSPGQPLHGAAALTVIPTMGDPEGAAAPAPSAGGVMVVQSSLDLNHLLRHQPSVSPHSPARVGKIGSSNGGAAADVGNNGSAVPSFQFSSGTTRRSSGAGGTAATAANCDSGSGDASSNPGRPNSGNGGANTVTAGHRTPRLGSPHGSGPVMSVPLIRAASCQHPSSLATSNCNGSLANGHATANGINQKQNGTAVTHHQHQQGQAVSATSNTGVVLSTAATAETPYGAAAGGSPQNVSSLSTALSLAPEGISLTRYESLQGRDSLSGCGGASGAQEESTLLQDPAVADLFRSIINDPFWDIRWSDLSHSLTQGLSNMVGSGSIGQVFAGVYSHAEVAIKVIGIDREMKYDLRALRSFKNEVDLNKRLNRHPNIVRFIGVCAEYIRHAARQAGLLRDVADTGEAPSAASLRLRPSLAALSASNQPMLAIVMEYCRMGTLYNMIGEAKQASRHERPQGHAADFFRRWTRRLEVLKGAAAGLEYMHQCNVIHHDFTSYNLLLEEKDGQWNTKVCDFNLSRVMARDSAGAALSVPHSGNFCSPRWQSPEYLSGEEYGWATDVFSFAVVIWEVVTLQRPWENELQNARYEPVAMCKMYADGKRLVFPKPQEIHPHQPYLRDLVELCGACWRQDPRDRPTMREVADTLVRLYKKVAEREKAAARAAAAKRQQQQQLGAATAPPPQTSSARDGAIASAAALAAVTPFSEEPSHAAVATVGATAPIPTPAPRQYRTPVSPFAAAAFPRPSASLGTSPESPGSRPTPAPAAAPRVIRISPFLTAQQNAEP